MSDIKDIQKESINWWSQNPMSYDWHKSIEYETGSIDFYSEIDSRFFNSSPFYKGIIPFDKLIPFKEIINKNVLEIGCGMGAHAQLLAQNGCNLTTIDITPRAIEVTKERLKLMNLKSDVFLMDAEKMEFEDNKFDFIWSWGVIHHSSNTNKIIEEVHRVLKPGGEFKFMVYNLKSVEALTATIRGILSGKFFMGMSKEEVLNYYTDGYIARYYKIDELYEILKEKRFKNTSHKVLGQTSEIVPIPATGIFGGLKNLILNNMPDSIPKIILSNYGSFLFLSSSK